MPRRTTRLTDQLSNNRILPGLSAAVMLVTALLATLPLAIASASASGLSFGACPGTPEFSCASLGVPLDRGGAMPGAVTLSVERKQAGAAPSEDAVVALAGGPGQAAIPLAPAIARVIAPALAGRDLIVFDQRGTGASGPLACSALQAPPASATIGGIFEQCALQIGSIRGSYTSWESAADIEAIRQAAGYRRLVLYGVSYGTKVALTYAERYPQNVAALVLDSIVPTGRSDPFAESMFKAMAPMFDDLCSTRACAGITSSALKDLAALNARLHKHSLRGSVYDGSGHRHGSTVSDVDLLNLLGAGDLNPALRALLPAAVRSALRGDPDPLLRLNLLSEGLIPNVPGRRGLVDRSGHTTESATSAGGIDEALFVDTTCEEAPFPWQRSAPPSTRLAEALAALRAVPASAFYPFSAAVEWQDSVLPGCAQWPNAAAPAPPAGALPDVPTLLLSGAQDVRTPTSNAQLIAARIPGAKLLVVPHTGHSVLGTDFSGCASAAAKAFFGGEPVQTCPTRGNPFAPTPLTPTKLAFVKPVAGISGRPGRTLAVVLDTIVDLERQAIGAALQSDQQLPSGSSFGGLRGGYARLTSTALSLCHLSFVPGVALSGTFPIKHGRLVRSSIRIEGRQAARGIVHIGGTQRVSGILGGRRFNVPLAMVKLAGAGANPDSPRLDLRFTAPPLAHIR